VTDALATMTWWGCAGVELAIGSRRLLFDPYIYPDEPRARVICITHNDYDHCHEPTLRRLTQGGVFERLIVPRTCVVKSKLDSPTHGPSEDLAFVDPDKLTVMYPKYTREPSPRHPEPVELELDGFTVEGVDSSERPQQFRLDPEAVWPVGTGPYVGDARFPNLGYVVSERETGLSFYHPGDLGEVFDAHRSLRDRIDVMFFPLVKLGGLELTMVDTIRPRYVVPIHYRLDTPEFPIPLHTEGLDLKAIDLAAGRPVPGADAAAWRDETHALMDAHWYPTPDPPLERIESIGPELEELGSKVLVLEAGAPHDLLGLRRGHETVRPAIGG
jgi:L-ascorbate metabolism protein UlaG (beta-lactamase superfamily)